MDQSVSPVLTILVDSPWIAAAVAVALWGLWKWRRRKVTLMAAGAWALYFVYEYLMRARVLCSGECNIRVDLLVLHPLLGTLAFLALLQSLRSTSADPSDSTQSGASRW